MKKSLDAALDLSVCKKEGFEKKERNFDETIDLILNLKDLDLNDPKQRIDKELILPHEITKRDKPNVMVIAEGEILLQAKNMGVDTMDPDELENLNREEKKEKKKLVKNYNFFIVEDKLMRDVARYLARFLGPLGKMPKPFPAGYGIISSVEDLETALGRYNRIVKIRMKKTPIIQTKIGKKSMDEEKILENMEEIISYVADQMPHKYNNFKSIYVKTTMGKPVKVDEDYLEEIGVM